MIKEKEQPKWWASDYSTKEKILFSRDRLLTPNKTGNNKFKKIISQQKTNNKHLNYDLSIGFLGDIMPINNKKIVLTSTLKKELNRLDILVVNIEGIITPKKRFLALSHNKSILAKLKKISPKAKIIVNLANNHIADFGKKEFQNSKKIIENYGFKTFGDLDNPYFDSKYFRLLGATYWNNQKFTYANSFNFTNFQKVNSVFSKQKINVFLPHWGYEMQLYPTINQVNFAENLKNWDLVVGNHSHCPQPTMFNSTNPKVIAFSLGNFCYSHYNPNHYGGAFLKICFNTKKEKRPKMIKSKYLLTEMNFKKNNVLKIKDVKKLNYSKMRIKAIKKKISYLSNLLLQEN